MWVSCRWSGWREHTLVWSSWYVARNVRESITHIDLLIVIKTFVVWWCAVITILWVSCWVLLVGPSPGSWGCYWAWPMSSRWRSLIDSSLLWWKRRMARKSAASYSHIQRCLLHTAVASLLMRCAEPSVNCTPSRRFVAISDLLIILSVITGSNLYSNVSEALHWSKYCACCSSLVCVQGPDFQKS